ncbi:MAG: hypothetical protein PUB52_10180 [Lachnospiraceae bacterium]|nr:hypothetical protein [Lachnospiraceae bacterium]
MDRKSIVRVSGIIGLLSQVVITVLSFVNRKIFLEIMGVEYLGITSTLSQILGMLALSEMGIQTVITYRLFKPIIENDYVSVNRIMTIYKRMYKYIALFISCASLLVTPFLGVFLKGITVPYYMIVIIWLLMSASTATTYLMSYNRALFMADQKEYKIKLIDLICNLFFSMVKIAIVVLYRNIILYILVDIANNVVSNTLILLTRKKIYPWFHKEKPVNELKKNVFIDIKNIFSGRIAAYVFNSTDSIVVSSVIGASSVSIMGNYTTITVAIKSLLGAIASPIQNIIGSYLAEKKSKNAEKIFLNYTFIIFVIEMFFLLPAIILVDDFVALFYGSEYTLNASFIWLLIASEYISVIQIPAGAMVDSFGLFAEQKKFLFTSAIINIVFSILGAYAIGISGVLVGTFIGNVYNWVMRTRLVYKKVIGVDASVGKEYKSRNFKYILIFCGLYFVLNWFFSRIITDVTPLSFVFKGLITVLAVLFLIVFIFGKTEEFSYLWSIIFRKSRG